MNILQSFFRQPRNESFEFDGVLDIDEDKTSPGDNLNVETPNQAVMIGAKKRKLNESSSNNNEQNVIDARMERIENALKVLTEKFDSFNLNASHPQVNQVNDLELDRLINDVRLAKTVEKISLVCPDIVLSENQLLCNPCNEEGTTETGKFSYDFSNGTDFTNKKQPREFINLKTHIARHLQTSSHEKATKQQAKRQKINQESEPRNFQIGKRLGRAAYKAMKKGGSYCEYEEEVSVLVADKVDVGNTNHSRTFASDFEKNVYDVLLQRTKDVLNKPLLATGKPTPLTIIADKVTPNRRTLQVVGIYGFINGKFQSIVAGVPEVISEDGVGVTRTLKKGLSNLDISDKEIETRCVGGAFDGEYFNLKVPHNLLESCLIDDEAKTWFSFQWDPAHILELAEHDTRKHPSSKYIQKTIDIVSDVSKMFSYGKSYRQAVTICEHSEMSPESDIELERDIFETENHESITAKKKFKAPRHFSNTRFATYSSKVLKTFIDNFDVYYKHMSIKQMDDLDTINNASFLFTIGALDSVYQIIGSASNAVQKPDVSPWEIKQLLDTYMNALQQIAAHLDQESFNSENISMDLLPTLHQMSKSVFEIGEFNSCAILSKKYNVQRTRNSELTEESNCDHYTDSLKRAAKAVSTFAKLLSNNAQQRLKIEREKHPILNTCEILFDVCKIKNYASHKDIQTHLDEYVKNAKKAKHISKDIKPEEIYKQYDEFISRIKKIVENFCFLPPNANKGVVIHFPERINTLSLYAKLYSDASLYENIQSILHLSLTALCRNHCEAVVEGMGSVLTAKNEKRGSLSNESLQRETFIRWQGPEAFSQSGTKLIVEALDKHFGGRNQWNFTTKTSLFNTSKVVDRHLQDAKRNEKITL